MTPPTLVMLAGPNGAGKTTFYRTYLADKGLPFINADELSGQLQMDAYAAADLANGMRNRLLSLRESFLSETVFFDPVGAKLTFLKQAVDQGYAVTLIYIGLASVALSKARILSRVRAGGHDVPENKLVTRYERSLNNLQQAVRELPRVILYDNSQSSLPFEFLFEFRSGIVHRKTKKSIPQWAKRILEKR